MSSARAYTRDAAYVEFAEDRKGRLAQGLMGDVVVSSRDLETMSTDGLREAR